MAHYYDQDGYPVRPRRSILETIAYMLIFGIIGLTAFLAWPALSVRISDQLSGSIILPTAQIGNVGGQAPPSVRGTNPDPVAAPAQAAPNVDQSIDAYNATATAEYNAAVASPAAPTPAPAPLPLNSAGEPVIDRTQQQQLDMSAQMAADEQQAALLAAQNADAANRAPDVSYEDAKKLLGRDPCSVPRANPHTCARGLFKPTPVQ